MVTTAITPDDPTSEFKGDIKVSNNLPSSLDLERIADLPVLDASGEKHSFKSLYSRADGSRRVLIIFIRHFFCGVCHLRWRPKHIAGAKVLTNVLQNCQEYLRAIASVFTPKSLLALKPPTEIVVIGHGQPDVISFYTKETGCPFPIYADPTKKLHDALGMTRTLSMGPKSPEYMQDSVVVNAVKSIFQEFRSGRNMMKGGDLSQVGGEFVFENNQVTWCHRMRNTRDHAEVSELRAVLGFGGDS